MVKGRHIEERMTRANPVSRPDHLHDDPAESEALLALILERRDEMTITKPAPTRPGRAPRWRPALVASAAGILVLIVVGVAALIGFTGGDSDVAETGTPNVPEEPGLLDGNWEHRSSPMTLDLDEVVVTSIGFFAPGSPDGILMSDDGLTWRVALTLPRGELIAGADPPPSGDAGNATTTTAPPGYTTQAYVESIIEFNGAVYAFGDIAENEDTPAMTVRQVAYRTTDGTEWAETVYASEAGSRLVLAGDDEIVIIVEEASVLRSEDGVTWVRHEPGLIIESAAFVGDRYLAVTVDSDAEEYEWGKRSVIESADGIEWSQIPGSDFAFNAFPRDPVTQDGRIYMSGLVYGEDGWQRGAVFVSADGSAWAQAEVPAIPELRVVTHLIPSEHGLFALGEALWSEDPELGDRLVPMTTVDGTTFVEIPHPAGLFDQATEAAAFASGDRMVVHRLDYESGTFHQWIWSPAN